MTNEELLNEAEDYAERHSFRIPYDGSNKFYDDKDYESSKEGYFAGAEPREKKIEELTEENNHLRRLIGISIITLNRIENQEDDFEKVVDNLRKLKELLGSIE